LGYGAARAVIARVRNTANIAISSFNYLLVKHVMCHVPYSRFPQRTAETASKTPVGVADRSADIWGLGSILV
jgi:hypothetical protein